MKLTLAYSTCPNDTFIFDAIANHKIDTEGLEFEITLADIDVLNQNAISNNKPDITKISSNAYGINIWKDYVILNSGSALGRNNGPMLVAKKEFAISEMNSKNLRFAEVFFTHKHVKKSIATLSFSLPLPI